MRKLVYRLAGVFAMGWLAGCATPPIPEGEQVITSEAPASQPAPTPPPKPEPLTIDEAVKCAVLCSPRIAALDIAVQVAKQQKRAVSDIQDPELGLAVGRDTSDDDRYRTIPATSTSSQTTTEPSTSTSQQPVSETRMAIGSTRQVEDGWRLSARFFVPNPWILGPQADARRADIDAARAERQNAIWFVTCEVRRLYAEIYFLKEDMALAAKQVRLGADILKAVQEQMELGSKLSSDVVTTAQRYLRIQDDFDQLRYRYKLAQRSLAALLNQSPEQLTISANAVVMPVVAESNLTFEAAEMTAKRCRGDLVALGWRTLSAKSSYREARNVRMPWLKDISASYRSSQEEMWGTDISEVVTYETGDGESEEWWIGFSMDVPIFSSVKNHADDVRQAEYKLARATEDEGIRLSHREIHDALDEVAESRQHQARYQRDVMPIIRSMQQTLDTLNDTPNAMSDKVAATELQIVESLRLELASRKRHLLALINLEYVTGAPFEQWQVP
jgi:hypothetical protein